MHSCWSFVIVLASFFGSCFSRKCLFYSGAVRIFLCHVADIALKLKSGIAGPTVCFLKRCKRPTSGIGVHKACGLGVGVCAIDVCLLSFLLWGGRNFSAGSIYGGLSAFRVSRCVYSRHLVIASARTSRISRCGYEMHVSPFPPILCCISCVCFMSGGCLLVCYVLIWW